MSTGTPIPAQWACRRRCRGEGRLSHSFNFGSSRVAPPQRLSGASAGGGLTMPATVRIVVAQARPAAGFSALSTVLLQTPSISALYLLYICSISALYRLYIGPISALYRLYIGIADGGEAVILSTGTPIPAQWACRRRCRYRADTEPGFGRRTPRTLCGRPCEGHAAAQSDTARKLACCFLWPI